MDSQNKPVLLIFPFGLLSHYLRCVVVAKYLSDYFEVMFAGHEDFSHFVEEEGFKTFSCYFINPNEAISQLKDFDFSWLNEKNIEQAFNSQVMAINTYRPVAVMGDAVPSLKMAAEHTSVTYISLFNGYMAKHYAGYRSLPKGHKLAQFIDLLPENLKHYLTIKGEKIAFSQIHKSFKLLRDKYNLKQTVQYLDEIEGDYNLICDLPELFPQKNLPDNYAVIGPLIYSSTYFSKSFTLKLNKNKKTIFVSMGSSGDWKDVRFLNDEQYSEYNIVCAGDKKHSLSAPHIEHIDFISAEDILPLTDLIICHGGNGTIYQALLYKIPLLCFPHHFEQEWNSNAIVKLGLATTVDKSANHGMIKNIIEKCIASQNDTNRHKMAELIMQAKGNQLNVIKSLVQELQAKTGRQNNFLVRSDQEYETISKI